MFGPDICGPGTKKVHVIFNYKGKNLLVKKDIRCKDDVFSHLYTLVVKPDNSYIVKIDNKKVESGDLEADWDFLPPKKIKVIFQVFLFTFPVTPMGTCKNLGVTELPRFNLISFT